MLANNSSIKVGDIFCSSWGYEQTNVCYYQVVRLVGKKSVDLQRIDSMTITTNPSSFTGKKFPLSGTRKSEVFRKRLLRSDYNGELFIKIHSFEQAYIWDGSLMSTSSYA